MDDIRGSNALGSGALPDFLIIGAQKCGTTSLYRALSAHPDVLWSTPKEVHFFNRHHGEGPDFYRSHFPSRVRLALRGAVRLRRTQVGEGTPQYLVHPRAPVRARRLLPDARILVLLRDPVERAWSHYRMAVRKERAARPFAEVVDEHMRRIGDRASIDLREEWKAHFGEEGDKPYLSKGIYADAVENWLESYPRDRIHVIHSADLFERPADTYARVLGFLGLRAWRPASFGRFNAEREEPLDPELRRRLASFFRPHNERLFELIGERYDWA